MVVIHSLELERHVKVISNPDVNKLCVQKTESSVSTVCKTAGMLNVKPHRVFTTGPRDRDDWQNKLQLGTHGGISVDGKSPKVRGIFY